MIRYAKMTRPIIQLGREAAWTTFQQAVDSPAAVLLSLSAAYWRSGRRRINRSSWLRSNPLLFSTAFEFLVDVVLFAAVNGIELHDIKADTDGARVV